jgi:hypothetical protein
MVSVTRRGLFLGGNKLLTYFFMVMVLVRSVGGDDDIASQTSP